jgi:hypothetical protein
MPKTYSLIQAQTLTSAGASVTFSNIPQNFTDLVVKVSARSTRAVGGTDGLRMAINGSTSDRTFVLMFGSGTSAISEPGSTHFMADIPQEGGSTGWTANTFANTEIYIPNYRNSNNKLMSVDSTTANRATTSYAELVTSLWSQTAAITSLTFTTNSALNFVANSTFYLYGVDGTRATGGTITSDADYTYHTFTSTNTFTALEKIKNAEVLVIAGGGGGGGIGGGGGAGGLVYASGQTFFAGTSYTALVGAGGNGATASGNTTPSGGVAGSNSMFASLGAIGGGAGGSYDGGFVSTSGGSSGGLGPLETIPKAATTGQGNQGGNRTNAGGTFYNSGGGGAGGVGGNASAQQSSGVGGVGSLSYTNWGSATNTGQNSDGTYYYAGGGGAGTFSAPSAMASVGGLGGGGQGSGGRTNPGVSGTANTGGGGGGGGFDNSSGSVRSAAGAGGSGLVIIRYPSV